MIDDLIHDFRLLHKADSLIARFWLRVVARRIALGLFAGLIAIFGLGMANVAGFRALEGVLGPVWAPAAVALFDFALAAIVWALSASAKPDPAIELAFDVRNMAVDALQADARELRTSLDAIGGQISGIKETVAGLVHNPLDAAAHKLLIPAALSLLRGLRAKKEPPS
jgi:hypothetical protein